MNVPIEILRCPISAQTMKPAPGHLLRELQKKQQAGALLNRGGEVADPFEDGLLTADGAWFYPISSGIPALLASAAIAP